MKPPGVIINVRAGRVVRNSGLVDRIRRQLPPENLKLTRDPGAVMPSLAALRDVGIERLVILGGDGSVTATLTTLLRV